MTPEQAVLYIVATPIGNLADISERAVEVLSKVDLIACEDTRHSKALLTHLGINNKLLAVHEHNEQSRIELIINKLDEGQSIALISDAGTPLISDPGYLLVRTLKSKGYQVSPIPGASAVITALSASGLATDKFTFEGFLSAKKTARVKQLTALKQDPRTMVFYESPHRIVATVDDCIEVMGANRMAAIARELTKKFETIISGSLTDIKDYLVTESHHTKGEFVLMIEGQSAKVNMSEQQSDQVVEVLAKYLPLAKAAAATAEITGEKKKQIYQRVLANKPQQGE